MITPQSARVTLARVLRAHGRRGEVACEILTDFPQRLPKLTSCELWSEKTGSRAARVLSCWISQSRGGQAIFHFEGSDSISDAEKLVGLEVQIPLAERIELPRARYYLDDLIGCRVQAVDASPVGVVADVLSTGEGVAGTPILVLDSPRGELLIPLAQEICIEIDVRSKRIVIVPPEGLLDLNRNS